MSTDHTEYLRKLTFKSELLIITSALPACFSSVDSTPASYFEDAEYRSWPRGCSFRFSIH